MSFDVNDPFNLKACFGPMIVDVEALDNFKFKPGMFLPVKKESIRFLYDTPVSFQFPCDFSVTRWPEGAEL